MIFLGIESSIINIENIENIALVTLWNFIYNTKFNSGKLQGVPFMFWIRKIMSQLTASPPPLSNKAGWILKILNSEVVI